MRRALPLFLLACPAFVAAADPADDKARLQGVWHSPADAKVRARVIVMGDKVGYAVGDVTANPPVPGSTFVGLADAKLVSAGGKSYAEVEITKDTTRKLEYRFEKDELVVGIDRAEYPLRRANTRTADPAAKPLAGTWTVTEIEAKGMKVPAKASGIEAVVFGDRYVWKGQGGKELLNSFYRVGEVKTGRAELDVYGMKADATFPSVVEVKGDELTIAQPLRPGTTPSRPAGFDTAAGDTLVIRATRAK
jgi:uncharacterized protein (TIGR03067 family)